MHYLKQLSLLAVAALALCAASLLQAAEGNEGITAQAFVEEASAKGIAEIEVARLALEEATSEEIREFAQTMIDDHGKLNQKLRELATRKNLDLSDEAGLIDRAKALVLELRAVAPRQGQRLDAMTKAELLDLARKRNLAGRSSMRKPELLEALRKSC
ncbi:DUF4142 domain-containing protein [Pseudomonas sp. SP16.1]|uniref:DUF4142 domain-containing protein n=1 Tax=Pseudomonas sp. SP16.1 TaxID=3458854 RepID=UPI004045AB14